MPAASSLSWLQPLLPLPLLPPSVLPLGYVNNEGYGRGRSAGGFRVEPVSPGRPLGLAASCFVPLGLDPGSGVC